MVAMQTAMEANPNNPMVVVAPGSPTCTAAASTRRLRRFNGPTRLSSGDPGRTSLLRDGRCALIRGPHAEALDLATRAYRQPELRPDALDNGRRECPSRPDGRGTALLDGLRRLDRGDRHQGSARASRRRIRPDGAVLEGLRLAGLPDE